jgi:hypothetical protein
MEHDLGASQANGLGSPEGPEPHSGLRPAGAIPSAIETRARRFLDSLADDYPFRIEGPDTISGFDGDRYGPCVSRPFPPTRRTWAFEREADRDAFASAIEARRAETLGSVEDESAVPKADAQTASPPERKG